MADDERLREALLELQLLRDREARVLRGTRALLECLETYSRADDADAALQGLLATLSPRIDAALCAVLTPRDTGAARIAAASLPGIDGQRIDAPIDLFKRARNVVDLKQLGPWAGDLDLDPYTGMLCVPAGPTAALFAVGPNAFGNEDLNLVKRLAGLAAQALQNRQIAAQNTLLAATISGSSSGFAIADATDPGRPLVYVNAAFEKLSGYSAAEVLGQNCRFLTAEPPDTPERIRLREAVKSGSGGTFLLRNRRKSGAIFWNELTLFPVHGPDGSLQNLVATQSDVTERVEAEADRDRTRARMETALAATEDAFLVLDGGGRVVFANGAVQDLFPAPGLRWSNGSRFDTNWQAYLDETRDMPGRTTALLEHADQSTIAGLAALPNGREVDLPDGRSILMRAGLLDDDGLVISATDVTAMRSAQNLLAQRLAAIEAATDGIAITDIGGRLIYMNSAAAQLLGFRSATSGLGQRWRERYGPGERGVPGQPFEATLTIGDATHEIAGSPLQSGGSVIVIRDVTQGLEAEAREAETMQALIRLQRQEAVAQLTAGVAHDFNNLLSAINGSVTLIEMDDAVPDTARPHLDRIKAAGAQSARLVNRLLDTGSGADKDGAFDLTSVLADLPALLQPSLRHAASFSISPPDEGMALRGAAETLTQILINLALNASDALTADGGAITLDIARVTIDETVPEVSVGALSSGVTYARLTMRDTGIGMTPDTVAQIFRPYFSTKGRQGSGLGLATAGMQVASVGGAVAVHSTPGVGTEITVYWPLAIHTAAAALPEAGSETDLSGMMLIVVDDDPAVSAVIASFLEARGAEVAVCEDPRDAAAAIEEDPTVWTALVSDYDMPVMNGGALAQTVRQSAPDLPIVIVTALARRLTDPRLDAAGVAAVLAKPVDLSRLASTLAEHAKQG